MAPRMLALCEIGKQLHIKNPKVKWTSFLDWVMLTYYRSKIKSKGMRLRTYALYVSTVFVAGIVAILVVIGSFCELQKYALFSRMIDYSYFILCFLNAISLLQLKFKFGF